MNEPLSFSEQDYVAAFTVQQIEAEEVKRPSPSRPFTLLLDAWAAEFLPWEGEGHHLIPWAEGQKQLTLAESTPAGCVVTVHGGNGRAELFQLAPADWLLLSAWRQGQGLA